MKNKSLTKNITLCGIFAALCIVFLYVGGLTVADLSILVICSIMTMIILVETGEKTAWIYAAVTSTLALILLPSKLYAIEYIMLSAVYPILKRHFERMRPLFAWPVKLSCLDCMLLLVIILGQYVFMAGDEFFALSAVTILVGTLFFIIYDLCLSACITVYMVKLRKKFKLNK
ncbi:MAG: hypothetical protein ACI4XJ_02610 [Eubacteriales bacterium]